MLVALLETLPSVTVNGARLPSDTLLAGAVTVIVWLSSSRLTTPTVSDSFVYPPPEAVAVSV